MTGSAPNAGVTTTGVSPASLPTASRSVSPTEELSLRGAPAELGDGTRVRIRPGRRSDGDLLLRGFERLSAESRYRRFLSPMPKLTEKTLRSLTDIDHRDHEAVLALDESGEGIGVARYVRDAGRPQAAEVAVTVVDGWQGRGLGTLLLEAICVRARAEGVRTFTASMLARNDRMLRLLEHLGRVRVVGRAGATIDTEVAIPPHAAAPRPAVDGGHDVRCDESRRSCSASE
jgi:GNAT superfamily N-acetyltransferase